MDAQGVSLDENRRIEAGLVVWAAGVKGPAVASNLDDVEISRRGQTLVADTLQTKSDERIFALGDCSSLAGANRKPLPSTAQVARQQALFLAKSLAGNIKIGAPLGHFKCGDMGTLVSFGGVCRLRHAWLRWLLKGRRLQGLAGAYGTRGPLPDAPA